MADADVVEEIDGGRALHGDVVDAMVDNVMPDGVELLHEFGDHQLGADAVDRGDHHGMAPLGEVDLVEAAEAADGCEHILRPRRRNPRSHLLEQAGHIVDVDARRAVRLAFALCVVHSIL